MAVDCYTRGDILNIYQGAVMARPDWRECLEAMAQAIGGSLTPPHMIPVHLSDEAPFMPPISSQSVKLHLVVADKAPPAPVFFEPVLTCGHPKSSMVYDHVGGGLRKVRCIDCEAENATDSGGNGG